METAVVNYSSFRRDLASWLDRVSKDHTPAKIIRQSSEDACVLMSEQDYSALMETIYLLSSPKNAERLTRSIEDYRNGKTQTFDPEQAEY